MAYAIAGLDITKIVGAVSHSRVSIHVCGLTFCQTYLFQVHLPDVGQPSEEKTDLLMLPLHHTEPNPSLSRNMWVFHKWGIPNSWLVLNGKSQSKMDDFLGVPP